MITVTSKIRDYISRNFLFSDKGFHYGDDASFMEEGIMDSLSIMELVSFVENEFGISVADHELIPDNFDSVSKLSLFIVGKMGSGS